MVIIGEAAFAAISDSVDVKAVPQGNLGSARLLISQAYEVVGIHKEAIEELAMQRSLLSTTAKQQSRD